MEFFKKHKNILITVITVLILLVLVSKSKNKTIKKLEKSNLEMTKQIDSLKLVLDVSDFRIKHEVNNILQEIDDTISLLNRNEQAIYIQKIIKNKKIK